MTLRLKVEKIEEIMRDFYILTGIRMVIFDNEYREIIAYPKSHCAFCNIMHNDPKNQVKCLQSNKSSFETCKKNNQLLIYQCHAGLIEATAPLLDGGVVIGYIMIGQIIDDKEKNNSLQSYFDTCDQDNISFEQFVAATNSITYCSKEQILAAAKILEACTFYVLFKDLISIEKDRFIYQLNHYIDQHIQDDISVQHLCEGFNISRTKLYEIGSHYLNIGIGEHIRNKRIDKAKSLLINTSYTITDIANLVGFQDYNYFCRVFKKLVNRSAKQYRNEGK